MTEEEARSWLLHDCNVSRETMDRLEAYAALVVEENQLQNLISQSSTPHIWARHIVDSAQLARFAAPDAQSWLDLGSGAGFPGLVIALLGHGQVTLVEERRLRADFLKRAVGLLGLDKQVHVEAARIERLEPRKFDVISARAFAPLPRLFEAAIRFATERTIWVLPKGRNAKSELEAARASWQGGFRVEPSLTDPDAFIIVAQGVSRRSGGSRSR
jgi:16S rRNA (guanine527-N7)-methyltransferase